MEGASIVLQAPGFDPVVTPPVPNTGAVVDFTFWDSQIFVVVTERNGAAVYALDHRVDRWRRGSIH